MIYLDFSKAFDKVPHQRLISKFAAHSVEGNVLRWIGQWLSNRKQRTVLNGQASDWGEVDSGVPQGSVLGPLAFIVFTNDIDDLTKLITVMNKFADDTKLGNTVTSRSEIDALQKCINDLVAWAEAWGMQFNTKKCKVMQIGRSNPNAQNSYTMNSRVLESTSEERYIGVKVHQSLRPGKQCAESARRVNAVLGQISQTFPYRNKYTCITCINNMCVPTWNLRSQHGPLGNKVTRRS